MSYLEGFEKQIADGDPHRFFQLWEEYCTSEKVDGEELVKVLKLMKESEMAEVFGPFVEAALPVWQTIKEESVSYEALRLIVDIQTTNSDILRETATKALENHYGEQSGFRRSLRLIGLRGQTTFQGAISHYELYLHLETGNFVFHSGGWGAGEVLAVSQLREEVTLELENVLGQKTLSFSSAFNALIPLNKEHFLTRRFAFPDELEAEARRDGVGVVRLLLADLGPKTAAEIKEEMEGLVIPESEWSRWWQGVRNKLKKDTMIVAPSSVKQPFALRERAVSHEEMFHKRLEKNQGIDDTIATAHHLVRDMPDLLKKEEVRLSLQDKLGALLSSGETDLAQGVQIRLLLENYFSPASDGMKVADIIQEIEDPAALIPKIKVVAFRKKLLAAIRAHREDWADCFSRLLLVVQPNQLKDFLLRELSGPDTPVQFRQAIKVLQKHPTKYPEAFIWYFSKVLEKGEGVNIGPNERCALLETFLVLLSAIEADSSQREILKKMLNILTAKRYAVVRSVLADTDLDFAREFLLLISKCHSIAKHDKKILRSLAAVVHPSLAEEVKEDQVEEDVIWTTAEGLQKAKEQLHRLAHEEIVENAREIEKARAFGDLSENSEYKFAMEKRRQLQMDVKRLSDQLRKARVLTPENVSPKEVMVGTKISFEDAEGVTVMYQILGPWDADADRNILSFQSKLAKSMLGLKEGDDLVILEKPVRVTSIRTIFA